MAAIVVRNIPDKVLSSLKKRAKLNNRSTEAEAREILKAAAEHADKNRVKIGSELFAIGRLVGGADLNITRDPRPIEPADFT